MNGLRITPVPVDKLPFSKRVIPQRGYEVRCINPDPKTASITQAVHHAGPLPGRLFRPLRPVLIRAVEVIGLAVIALSMVVKWGIGDPQWLLLGLLVIPLGGIIYLGVDSYKYISGSRRLHLAVSNGWLNLYPGIISELKHRKTSDSEGAATHYYCARARIFLPDGTTALIATDEFIYAKPKKLERRGAVVVETWESANFDRDNGWALFGCLAGRTIDQASFCIGLTRQQIEAGVKAAYPHFGPVS